MGVALREWGRIADALPHFMRAADYFGANGSPEERVYTAAERAILLSELGDYVMAENLARTAVERSRSLANPPIEMSAHRSLGIVLRDTGRLLEARPYLLEAVRLAESTVHRILHADAHEEVAVLELLEDNEVAAETHRVHALEVFRSMGLARHCERLSARLEEVLAGVA
jgi:tetratricopeptide (TPR) repeat protein